MDAEDFKKAEARRLDLVSQLDAARTALRGGLQVRGFGATAREHMERALAHVQEAHVALNEIGRARTVSQLVNDLIRVQRVVDDATQGTSPKI